MIAQTKPVMARRKQKTFMISLGDLLVFIIAASIVATYVATVHHFLTQAGAEDAVNAPPVAAKAESLDERHGNFMPAHSH